MKLTKSITFILKKVTTRVLFTLAVFCCVALFLQPAAIVSIIWGTLFSFCIFFSFTYSKHLILLKKNKSNFLILYFVRLFMYVVSLSVGMLMENYFNFFIILIFLFHYQIHYILFEFFRSYKKYKRNFNNG